MPQDKPDRDQMSATPAPSTPNPPPQETIALDDERRVKVLSPSMLFFRRFIRNRLAILGVAILLVMTFFSVVGPFISPYRQDQVFTHDDLVYADFAGIMVNDTFRYTVKEGASLSPGARAQLTQAVNRGLDHFAYRGVGYDLTRIHDEAYAVTQNAICGYALLFAGRVIPSYEEGFEPAAGFEDALKEAVDARAEEFTFENATYDLAYDDREVAITVAAPVALASYNVVNFATAGQKTSFAFSLAAEQALAAAREAGESEGSFTVEGRDYRIVVDEAEAMIYEAASPDDAFASLSKYIVQPVMPDVFIEPEFKEALLTAVEEGESELVWGEEDPIVYRIRRENLRWNVRGPRKSQLVSYYMSPSWEHWVGTDGNGMDLLTRLMYGGRISLSIGFVVVLISLLIGVTMGGISGYFGGWVDMLIMRAVDVFYCIPTWPILIIFGSVMDTYRVNPYVRLVYLMMILGFLSWAGIARLVRGQILSLREQEFMVAAEASGLSVYRRIFKHLVPNVIPQLIIIATGTLGSTILTESTLSFLGLGVKYPIASWGNIITAVSDVNVMTNYLFVWVPASLCIVITVLGFNFVGDGLRDAFDPKMKR